ncbi:uncharacterized protein SPPG_09119 [Spizellomyces punctatus DAOM BR117]|uniref:Uncharacterized protein n=1 Tax=Spizellomyces punctatus (strain DAOM BR117) TaxID=645134 RepID=A0A0L0HLI4_SPIPD|nr:uncharacterized protein SPPG_09119 [Spizellomyces punctatus DAOM BR117]KND01664.1 hypothetical protein SPPG_09119 [Spizellomyces punctatus DAOM BR117]|eukprot:XP_016609703.1 hypothetical protein SPPG_09119 [Spizellomyces punctatus DAOM BR117]
MGETTRDAHTLSERTVQRSFIHIINFVVKLAQGGKGLIQVTDGMVFGHKEEKESNLLPVVRVRSGKSTGPRVEDSSVPLPPTQCTRRCAAESAPKKPETCGRLDWELVD